MLPFLTRDAVVPALKVGTKKAALHEISRLASRILDRDERDIFETLQQRERLGSTGIGDGIAIPHGKLPGLERLFGLIARVEKPVDFESLDGRPVDILFLLLAPDGAGADHLKALARVARELRDPGILERIRAARDGDALYAVLTQESTPRAA